MKNIYFKGASKKLEASILKLIEESEHSYKIKYEGKILIILPDTLKQIRSTFEDKKKNTFDHKGFDIEMENLNREFYDYAKIINLDADLHCEFLRRPQLKHMNLYVLKDKRTSKEMHIDGSFENIQGVDNVFNFKSFKKHKFSLDYSFQTEDYITVTDYKYTDNKLNPHVIFYKNLYFAFDVAKVKNDTGIKQPFEFVGIAYKFNEFTKMLTFNCKSLDFRNFKNLTKTIIQL